MKNRKVNRPIIFTIICIIAIIAAVSVIQFFSPGRNGKSSAAEDIGKSEESTQSEPREANPDEEGTSGAQPETGSSSADSAKVSADENVSLEFHEEDSSSFSETQIGIVTVRFRTDDALIGEGTVLGEHMDSILFHDGIEDDMKGYMFATKVDYNGGTVDTLEAAQASVGEYIPAGSGISSNWEQTELYFIRKAVGYDNEADGSFIFYTIVPKSDKSDPYLYSIVAVGYEGDLIKESSYNSMMDAMKGQIMDSELLNLTYDDACTELKEALYNQSGEKLGMNGVDELRDANMQWYHDVYGVDSMEEYEAMSEEEKKERYWKYKDPIGYAQLHEEEIAAENAGQDPSDDSLDGEDSDAETETGTEIGKAENSIRNSAETDSEFATEKGSSVREERYISESSE